VFDKLCELEEDDEREVYLKKNSPGLYVAFLKAMKRKEEYSQHLVECKDSIDDYSIYVHCYLRPQLNQLDR